VGYSAMAAGVLIMLFGIGQFAFVSLTTADANPNPAGSGMLMALCWVGGIAVAGTGAKIAGILRSPLW